MFTSSHHPATIATLSRSVELSGTSGKSPKLTLHGRMTIKSQRYAAVLTVPFEELLFKQSQCLESHGAIRQNALHPVLRMLYPTVCSFHSNDTNTRRAFRKWVTMKKRIGLVLGLGLLASLSSAQGAIVSCAGTTLSALIALGSGPGNGCVVDDKLFNGFSYAGSTNAPAASLVNASLDSNTATLTYGWTFTSATGAFLGNFTLGYTVTVIASLCPTCVITSDTEQLLAGNAPPGPVSISVAESAGLSPITIDNATFGDNTNGNSFAGVTTLTKLATTSGISATTPLLSFESDVRQTVLGTVPEPATFSLMGIALLGVGLVRRRRSNI